MFRRVASILLIGLLIGCSWLTACRASGGGPGVDLAAPSSAIAVQGVQVSTAPEASTGLLRYTFQPHTAPTVTVKVPDGWAGMGVVHLQAQNLMGWAVTLVVDIDGAAPGETLHAVLGIPAGSMQTIVVPLAAGSPRDMGMQAGPPMPYESQGNRVLVATTVEGRLDPARVRQLRLSMMAPNADQVMAFGRLEVQKSSPWRDAYAHLVDSYGQYQRANWPEKVASDDALRQAVRAPEQAQKVPVVSGKAGGWFRVAKRDGRWQLLTPDGKPFFSLGVNAVSSDGGRTYVEGREWMFDGLPGDSGAMHAFYGTSDNRRAEAGSTAGMGFNHGRWFDFYAANLERVDGASWQQAWRHRTLDRLASWGFNTLGNWSDPALADESPSLAYTRSINIAGPFGNVSSGYDYWGRMPDPFDPAFAQAAEAAVVQATSGVKDDPRLLGYFADNELAWAGQGPEGRWGLALGTLRGEPRSHAKQAFIAQLKAKYGDIARLNAAWGLSLADWNALQPVGFQMPLPQEAHPAIADDASAWLRRYADQYFQVVTQALRRHDPHHLFLGGRFAVNTPEAVAACAKYCDVISFNSYTDVPQHGVDMQAMARLDKPVLITEFHFGSDDRGPFGKGVVSVWNEQQRGEAYARYVQAAVADPHIVGVHWFQYADQPVTGRLLDGENAHIGLVGITDIPFRSFVEAVSRANREAAGR